MTEWLFLRKRILPQKWGMLFLKENAVNNIIEINDFNAPELDIYARTSEI